MPSETNVAAKAISETGWDGLGRKSLSRAMLRAPSVLITRHRQM